MFIRSFSWLLLWTIRGISAECTTEVTLTPTFKCSNVCGDATTYVYSLISSEEETCQVFCPDGTELDDVPFTICESAFVFDNPTSVCVICRFAIDCDSTLIPGFTVCGANVKNPIGVTDRATGSKKSIGTDSSIIFYCKDGVPRSSDTCGCQLSVDGTVCNECGIAYINITETNSQQDSVLVPNFDCTNVQSVTSDCAVYIDGYCMSSIDEINDQLYTNCQNYVSTDGATYSDCFYNTASPMAIPLSNGRTATFGTESYALVRCQTDVPRSVDTCSCAILVNPSDPVTSSDFCESCAVVAISETRFVPQFDCSNRLTGECVGFDVNTQCISNIDGTNLLSVPTRIDIPAQIPLTLPTQTAQRPASPITVDFSPLPPSSVLSATPPIPPLSTASRFPPHVSPDITPIVISDPTVERGSTSNVRNGAKLGKVMTMFLLSFGMVWFIAIL